MAKKKVETEEVEVTEEVKPTSSPKETSNKPKTNKDGFIAGQKVEEKDLFTHLAEQRKRK